MNKYQKPLLFFALFTSLIVTGACSKPTPEEDKPKKIENASIVNDHVADKLFNSGWEFFRTRKKLTLEQAKMQADWKSVHLPHTMKIEPLIVNDQFQGEGWYRKKFETDKSWQEKNAFLRFEGAMNVADVWLNGKHLTRHLGGYLPFTVQLNEFLNAGENTLFLRLNNEDNPITGPKPLDTLDFNMYGGLYRNVYLRLENDVYISDAVHADIPAGGGLHITYPEVSREKARVKIKTHVKAAHAPDPVPHSIKVEHRLYRGNTLITKKQSEVLTLSTGQDQHVQVELQVDTPALWHPHSPNLYTLETVVFDGEEIADKEEIKIGIREFMVTEEGVFINGEKLWLRGVNRHQEYPFIGYALSPQANYRDAWRIKSAGFDYVRLSHYPHSRSFIRAADELGLVLMDAILGWQFIHKDPEFVAQVQQTCRDMIRRDRNHPSIFAWECSLNESWMEDMEPFIEKLNKIVHEELPVGNVYSAGWVEYGYDIYLQARQHRIEHYDPPAKPYIVSEYGDWEYYAMNAGLNQDQWGDLLKEERSSRQLLQYSEQRLLQQATNIQEAHNDNFDTVAEGDGYWVMFDYNRGYADDLEASGVMSIDRLPKFSYYFFQSQRDPGIENPAYDSGPMVFIASYWQKDSARDVRVFSNADEVELLLNGNSLGKHLPARTSISENLPHPPFIFELDEFVPGELEAKAYIGGEVVATHKVATPEAPHNLQLYSDFALGGVASAPGDVVFVYAELQNKNGLKVPHSGVEVAFEVVNGAEIIGPATAETAAGIASVLLKITSLDTPPQIKAMVNGLPSGRVYLE